MSKIIYITGFNSENSNQEKELEFIKGIFKSEDALHFNEFPPEESASQYKNFKPLKYFMQKDSIRKYASELEIFIRKNFDLKEVTLIGHSLGAALVIDFLMIIKGREKIKNAILLGAAFEENCTDQYYYDLLYSVTGVVWNIYNPYDMVLRDYFKKFEGGDAIGAVGMPIMDNDFIKNICEVNPYEFQIGSLSNLKYTAQITVVKPTFDWAKATIGIMSGLLFSPTLNGVAFASYFASKKLSDFDKKVSTHLAVEYLVKLDRIGKFFDWSSLDKKQPPF